MSAFLKTWWGELVKQHRNYFHSKMIYVSLFLWPVFSFITTCYSYRSFEMGGSAVPYLTEENLIVYLVLGYMCMSFFRSLVQSAWNFSFERTGGTLELIFLSPANRLAVLLGNASSSLVESTAVMVFFGAALLLWKKGVLYAQFWTCLAAFLMLALLALLWGVLLNALFLFSRDTGFLFTILEEPMETFAGVKVPAQLYPGWARAVSLIFPLTLALETIRKCMLGGSGMRELLPSFAKEILISAGMLAVVCVIIRAAERHVRRAGNLTLF